MVGAEALGTATYAEHLDRYLSTVKPAVLSYDRASPVLAGRKFEKYSPIDTRWCLCTAQQEYVDAIARTYRQGLFGAVVSYSGWTPHDLGKPRFPDDRGDPIGEHASCADVAELALWLAMQAGQTDLLDDVERLLRARILPSQIIDPSQPRQHGGWGAYAHGFGRGCILDVFAAVLSVLIEVHRAAVSRSTDGVVSVNLTFSIQTPLASVEAVRGARGTAPPRRARRGQGAGRLPIAASL